MAHDLVSLLYANLVPAATLSGGSWLGGLPLGNLKTTELAARARSTSAAEAHTKFIIDHGTALAARVVWLPAHNLTAAAQLRVLRGTTSGGSDVYAGAWADVWHITPVVQSGDVYGAFHVMPAANSARYTTVEISDTANPAGYVELGQALCGDVITLSVGPSQGMGRGLRDFSTVTEADSGAPWTTQRRKQRSVSLLLELLESAEADTLQDIRVAVGTHSQVVYLPSLTQLPQLQRYGFVGRLRELSDAEYPFQRFTSLPIKLTEWL
jgi:hypothetical protein